ncbi:MAG: hypothetical protein GX097_06320 [Methanomicrobiales archaeon]|jgi:hypothetical protein|nr:hypothetical protein [Methanomicrobiales archaeon]NLO78093.1 hypothetical protein [Methanomicrobiales archaeon]
MTTGFDGYMNAYLDRRMRDIIEEWNLGTVRDLEDYPERLRSVETEIQDMGRFTRQADTKLTEINQRLQKVREAKQ